jgi:hypothetical protein
LFADCAGFRILLYQFHLIHFHVRSSFFIARNLARDLQGSYYAPRQILTAGSLLGSIGIYQPRPVLERK